MGKLQQIKRTNGSIVSSVNIPKEIIDARKWEKGQSLEIKDSIEGVLIKEVKDGTC